MALKTKRCPKCGWEYAFSNPLKRCRFCNTPIREGICSKCGNPSDNIEIQTGLCLDCYRPVSRNKSKRAYNAQSAAVKEDFNEWLALIRKVPKNYPTITEAQWLEVCAYFDGCALCKSEHINTRGFFIAFKFGGRYCAWNVIPLCEDCAKKFRALQNPFRVMHRRLGEPGGGSDRVSEHWHNSEKRLQKIIAYLRPRLEEAANDK